MCDNALTSGFALSRKPIDGQMVREVCRDFDLRPTAAAVFNAIPDRAPARPA